MWLHFYTFLLWNSGFFSPIFKITASQWILLTFPLSLLLSLEIYTVSSLHRLISATLFLSLLKTSARTIQKTLLSILYFISRSKPDAKFSVQTASSWNAKVLTFRKASLFNLLLFLRKSVVNSIQYATLNMLAYIFWTLNVLFLSYNAMILFFWLLHDVNKCLVLLRLIILHYVL